MIFEKLFTLKIPAILISGLITLIGLLAILQGAFKTYEALLYLLGIHEGKPGITIIEAVDTYLFALVILILGGGIFKLFVGDENTFKNNPVLSKITSFVALKVLLWEALLLTLTVWAALEFFISEPEDLRFELLILPASVLILAVALRLLTGQHKPEKGAD